MKVFDELKERKVLQTAALYFAIAWGVTEVLSFLIERIPVFPAWTETAIAILFVLGFPVTVFLAWMFDVGRDGVRRADPASGIGKGVIVLSVAGLFLVTGMLSYLLLPKIEAEQGRVREGDLGTVAVLTFENLTGDPSLGYLGAGLAEDIRQRLSLHTDLTVIGRVSMAGFVGAGTDLASLRNILGAAQVLEGSVQRVGGELQVGLALLDTSSGKQLWSNVFTARESGWDPLRQRIVATIGEQLELTVRVKEEGAPVSDTALNAYLRGLAELAKPEVADGWFDEAIGIAPEFADAWARKALLRLDMLWSGMHHGEAWQESVSLVAEARRIEPRNLMADIAEAQLLWLAKGDPIGSCDLLRETEARAPNHPLVVGGLGNCSRYIPDGQQEAVAYSRRYLALDPLNPDAHLILGTALTFQHRYDEGFEHYRRAEELDPNFLLVYEYWANQEFFRRSPANALAIFTRLARVSGRGNTEMQRCMLYIAGELIPPNRAVILLEDAVRRGVGMTQNHPWCQHPLEVLSTQLERLGDVGRLQSVRSELEQFRQAGGAITDKSYWVIWNENAAKCEDELCRLRALLGDEEMDAWLGTEPPIHSWSGDLAVDIYLALMDAGRDEEARDLAATAGAGLLELAGPAGYPTVAGPAILLLALSGDSERALDYMEQVGPEGFYVFGVRLRFLDTVRDIPGFTDNPRMHAFAVRSAERQEAEVAKFDRMVASGEIVLP